MWKFRFSEFGKAVRENGKYYWGYFETGTRPIGTVTLEELCKTGFVEKHFGTYQLVKDSHGSFAARELFNEDDQYVGNT